MFVLGTPTHHSPTLHYPLLFICSKAPYFECKFKHLDEDQYLSWEDCIGSMQTKRMHQVRCECVNCLKNNCGACENCLDMRKFGGPGRKKQRCEERVCCNNNNIKKMKSK